MKTLCNICKSVLFFLTFIIAGVLYLWNVPRLSAWVFYKSVLAYALTSIAGYVLLFVFLYRILKKHHSRIGIAHINIQKTRAAIGIPAMLLFFFYIIPLYWHWGDYSWRFYVDNGSDRNVEFTVNGEAYSVSANSFSESYDLIFHCRYVTLGYNGRNYDVGEPGSYLFNIDSLNSYYFIEHKIHYHYYPAENYGFSLTDSIMYSAHNFMFLKLPHSIDQWFEYPKEITIRIKTDKNGDEKRELPEKIYSIMRISEYDELLMNNE